MLMDATEKWSRTIRRRIYLLRHGDVSYFDEHGRPFWPATVPLNQEGRLQAEAAGRVLAEVPLLVGVTARSTGAPFMENEIAATLVTV